MSLISKCCGINNKRMHCHSKNSIFIFYSALCCRTCSPHWFIAKFLQMKKGLCCIVGLLLLVQGIHAQPRQQLISNYFSTLTSTGRFNGGVLVAEKGKILYENQFGYADLSTKQPISFSSRFSLASVSKTIVATAILQLSQQGRLQVNEPVQKYLPAFPYPGICIRHLLSHTSGLPPYNTYFAPLLEADSSAVFTNADFLRVVAANKAPLLYQPGEKENYDNVNYIVLALLVEKITGRNYDAYIQEKIMKPAGISMQAVVAGDQLTKTIYPNYAQPYLQPSLYSESMVKAAQVPFIVFLLEGLPVLRLRAIRGYRVGPVQICQCLPQQ
ncbi:MAG: class A beta-lactamase-related serine hydrolase [Chitinophagaceae bacterium]|nr:MAG: class A beta-lactamase-related serine hydrolase [Chitinophagaceae bacterium]